MRRHTVYSVAVVVSLSWAVMTAQVKRDDEGARPRANLAETLLTTAVVDGSRFGRLYAYPVDGPVYAQPVYVSNVTINGARHNVLYVTTAKRKLYAFDADAPSAMPLWISDLAGPSSLFSKGVPEGAAHSAPTSTVAWNSPTDGPLEYVWPENDVLQASCRTAGGSITRLCMQGGVLSREFPAALTLSANGSTHGSGILWAALPANQSGIHEEFAGVLIAHDAETLNEIWTSEQNPARDRAGRLPRFVAPVVANGRVYMPNMDGSVVVYGLLPGARDADVNVGEMPRQEATALADSGMVTATAGVLAEGAAIGINFLGTHATPMAATESAGVVPQTRWNNATGSTRSVPLALVDAAGQSTSATVTWTANNGWMTSILDQPGNARLMKGYLDNNNTSRTMVTVTGLPSRAYDVYVYTDGDNKAYHRTATYTISGPGITSTTTHVVDPPNTNFSGTFIEAAGSSGNYVRFRINSTAFTVNATPGTSTNTNVRAPINGIQIVPAALTIPRAIGINFLGTSTSLMAATETAGVVPQTGWNNAVGAARSTPLPLVDDAGKATTASVTWTANNGWMTPITDSPGNARMMKGYLDNNNTSITTVTVTGLPAAAYDVYVYSDGDNKAYTRTASYKLTGPGIAEKTIGLTDAPNRNFSGTFIQGAGTAGNYVKFNFSGTQFTLTAIPGTSTNLNVRAPVNGIQIVNASVPPLPVVLEPPLTVSGIGAGQGVEVRDGKVYLYGDAATGIIREYDVTGTSSLTYTGRQVLLTVGGSDLVPHPTGFTTAPGLGTLLGNTVSERGTIRWIDWPRALSSGTLDGAVLGTVADDLAVNGTRPEFVRVGDRWLVATADYGAVSNAIRIYDPERLKTAARTSEPGVLVHRFPSSPYVQTLHWIDSAGLLVLVQNRTSGAGWRLTVVDLAQSIAAGREVATQTIDLSPTDELEGFHLVTPERGLFLTSASVANVYFANVRLF